MKRNVLVVGAGGVAHVVAHKCAQNNAVLGDIHIASRTPERARTIVESIEAKGSLASDGNLDIHQLDATDVHATKNLIEKTGCDIVINVASAFVNMAVLSACIETGAAYLDTAIHEDPLKVCESPPWYSNYEWKRRAECRRNGITAILGVGFDPGVVNAYAALAQAEYFDRIDSIDIIDVNAGEHRRYFATNFDPEINFREFTGKVWTWQDSQWRSNRMFEVKKVWDLPEVGRQVTYLAGHDEIHSLSANLGVPNIRFWMGFSDRFISVFTVLKNLGLLSEKPLTLAGGQEVVPLKVVKAVLPDPASLAAEYRGKTCIGTLVRGSNAGETMELFFYNVCDHGACFEEVESQAISYTAGVPPTAAAMLVAEGVWDIGRMVNVEELPPQPFLDILGRMGLTMGMQQFSCDVPV